MRKQSSIMRKWYAVYDEGDDDANKDKFTPEQQEVFNKAMAAERRKYQDTQDKLKQEIEALKAKSTLTSQEREDLDKRVETLTRERMTLEEQFKHDLDKTRKEYDRQLTETRTAAESWQKRYSDAVITQSLTEAAVVHKAKNPVHIMALLRSGTAIAENVDEDGKPTGVFIPKVKFDTVKDGKPITLELSPLDAVKRLSEMEEHENLFSASGSGGTGNQNSGTGRKKDLDIKELASDPKAYREARKTGKITL